LRERAGEGLTSDVLAGRDLLALVEHASFLDAATFVGDLFVHLDKQR
jgi:hypothetical protein